MKAAKKRINGTGSCDVRDIWTLETKIPHLNTRKYIYKMPYQLNSFPQSPVFHSSPLKPQNVTVEFESLNKNLRSALVGPNSVH